MAQPSQHISSFQQLLNLVDAFSDQDLTDPQRFTWLNGRPLWGIIIGGPGYFHYQGHIYDLVRRIAPEKRYVVDAGQLESYTGAYALPGQSTLTFRRNDDHLALHIQSERTDKEVPCLAVDDVHFAHDSGLVTFHRNPDGSVPSLECWTRIFTRTKDR